MGLAWKPAGRDLPREPLAQGGQGNRRQDDGNVRGANE